MSLLQVIKNKFLDTSTSRLLVVWLLGFLVLSLVARGIGGTNEMSRYATMEALSEDFSFEITKYKGWTLDWSVIGDRYYSNKAPGPAFIGLPAYFLTGLFLNKISKSKPPKSSRRVFVVLISKLIPMCLALFWWMSLLIKEGYIDRQKAFLGLCLILYGGTHSLFYNSFFGHGTSSLFILFTFLSILTKRFPLAGLCFGLSLLSEYAAAVFLIPLVLIIPFKKLHFFILGGVIPGVLWIIFHLSTTGSPFVTITSFMNPAFLSPDPAYYGGMLGLPKFSILLKLLFGSERGLLFTQPWVLFSLIHLFWLSIVRGEVTLRKLYFSIVLSSILLLLLNCSFNNWHGGATSGPRYLSMMILPLAIGQIFALKQLKNELILKFFYFLVLVSLTMRSFIYSTTPLAIEGGALYSTLYAFFLEHGGSKSIIRFLIFWIVLFICFFGSFKKVGEKI